MRILIVTPAPPGSRAGNRITAERWARLLGELGHHVELFEEYDAQPGDALIALHARKSATSIERFYQQHPEKPLIVALTGTDLYSDIQHDSSAQRSLELAWRLVLLQPHGIGTLPQEMQERARVVYQSVHPLSHPPQTPDDRFPVCVIGHLRPVKDPFRAALAARLLPASSKIQIIHLGAALSRALELQALTEAKITPRYRWLGDVDYETARRHLAHSRLLVVSSHLEGGPNVISEALAERVPVLSSRISGSIGILGEDYPGYFPVGDTHALAELMLRAEEDSAFYATLKSWCENLSHLVDPVNERRSWQQLLEEWDS